MRSVESGIVRFFLASWSPSTMESGFSVLSLAGVARALGAVAADARVPAAGGIRSF